MPEVIRNQRLDRITEEIVAAVLELIKGNIYKIVLYGSYARGDFTKESDIDLMIVLDCTKEEVRSYRQQISKLASRLGLKYDIEISLLLRDRDSYENGQQILPFYRNIAGEGVALYG